MSEQIKRLEGCNHSQERMIKYINESACPVCLLAELLKLRKENERLQTDSTRLRKIEAIPPRIEYSGGYMREAK